MYVGNKCTDYMGLDCKIFFIRPIKRSEGAVTTLSAYLPHSASTTSQVDLYNEETILSLNPNKTIDKILLLFKMLVSPLGIYLTAPEPLGYRE